MSANFCYFNQESATIKRVQNDIQVGFHLEDAEDGQNTTIVVVLLSKFDHN